MSRAEEDIPFNKLSKEKQEAVGKTIREAIAHFGLQFIMDDNECRKRLLAYGAPIQYPIERMDEGGGTLVTGQSGDGKVTFIAAYWANNPDPTDNGLGLAIMDRHKLLKAMEGMGFEKTIASFGMIWLAIAYTFGFDAVERLKSGGNFWDSSSFMS